MLLVSLFQIIAKLSIAILKYRLIDTIPKKAGLVELSRASRFSRSLARLASGKFQLVSSPVYTVNTLLKVVGYYDLSVLSISDGFPKKKVWMGGECGELYPNCFGFFLTLQSP